MRVYWTDRAKARLHAIRAHIAESDPQAAKSQVEKILRRSAELASPPDIGHPVTGYENTALREVLIRPYRLIYISLPTQIDIISVVHYRQLIPQDLHELSRLAKK